MDQRKEETDNIIEFEIKKPSERKDPTNISRQERVKLKEKLEKRLNHLQGAITAIDASRASRTASMLSTQEILKSLQASQDQFKKFYSPWADLNKSFQMPIPKSVSPWKSLSESMPKFDFATVPSELTSKSISDTLAQGRQALERSHETLDMYTGGSDRLSGSIVPNKIEETTEAIDKMAQSLEKHFTEERAVNLEQLKLLRSLAESARLEMEAQKLQFCENQKTSNHANKQVQKTIALGALAVFIGVIAIFATLVPYWFPNQDPVSIAQPIAVKLNREDIEPLLQKLDQLSSEVDSLKKKASVSKPKKE